LLYVKSQLLCVKTHANFNEFIFGMIFTRDGTEC